MKAKDDGRRSKYLVCVRAFIYLFKKKIAKKLKGRRRSPAQEWRDFFVKRKVFLLHNADY